jgi:hypothetical protein
MMDSEKLPARLFIAMIHTLLQKYDVDLEPYAQRWSGCGCADKHNNAVRQGLPDEAFQGANVRKISQLVADKKTSDA